MAGSDLFVYPMKMARIATPQKLGFETPPHQDAHSHHTGPSMAGIWVGLHDAGESSGRLTLLPGSHRRGVRPVHRALGVGGVQCEIYADETTWHVSDVQRGDVHCLVGGLRGNSRVVVRVVPRGGGAWRGAAA